MDHGARDIAVSELKRNGTECSLAGPIGDLSDEHKLEQSKWLHAVAMGELPVLALMPPMARVGGELWPPRGVPSWPPSRVMAYTR
jgi:hypothetical protein